MRRTVNRILCATGLLTSLLMAATASATTYAFTCYCLSEINVGAAGCGPRGPKRMTVKLNRTTGSVASTGQPAMSFKYDPSYRSATLLRYTGLPPAAGGRTLRPEKKLLAGGYSLHNGGKGGYLNLDYRGDAYESVKYICRR